MGPSQRHVHVTLSITFFGKSGFADVVSDLRYGYADLGCDPSPVTVSLEEKPRDDGEGDWGNAATSQGCLGPPGAGGGRKDPPRSLQGEGSPADTLIPDSGLQNGGDKVLWF